MAKKPTKDEVWGALNDLRKTLNSAYWEISDQKEADRILAMAQDIDSIQDDMDRDEIISNNSAYKALVDRVDTVCKKLDSIKKQIDDMIHKVETATKIIGYIDKAVGLAAKYFI